jgi:hypothetical protein
MTHYSALINKSDSRGLEWDLELSCLYMVWRRTFIYFISSRVYDRHGVLFSGVFSFTEMKLYGSFSMCVRMKMFVEFINKH